MTKLLIPLAAALAALALSRSAAALTNTGTTPARLASQSTCCLKVTIDANGAYVADYGPESSDPAQQTAGTYLVDWHYHVRGLAKYVEFGAGNGMVLFLWRPNIFRARAVYAAGLQETDLLRIRTPTGWYDDATNGTHCRGGHATDVELPYRPWEQGWGNGVDAPAIRADVFNPVCGGTQPYDAGLFRGLFRGYLGFRFPAPSAHRAQLRSGTMHASTVCTDWKQTQRTAGNEFAFRGFMTEEISLDSLPPTALAAKTKALGKLLGHDVEPTKGYDSDPAGFFDVSVPMRGKTGCHAP